MSDIIELAKKCGAMIYDEVDRYERHTPMIEMSLPQLEAFAAEIRKEQAKEIKKLKAELEEQSEFALGLAKGIDILKAEASMTQYNQSALISDYKSIIENLQNKIETMRLGTTATISALNKEYRKLEVLFNKSVREIHEVKDESEDKLKQLAAWSEDVIAKKDKEIEQLKAELTRCKTELESWADNQLQSKASHDRVPKGYTAEELENDNPYNQWMKGI